MALDQALRAQPEAAEGLAAWLGRAPAACGPRGSPHRPALCWPVSGSCWRPRAYLLRITVLDIKLHYKAS